MDFDTRHLRAFLALAEELHFTKAARRLFVTQPTLSKYVRRVEEQVGYPLFDRSPRGVHLTDEGAVFRRDAERLIAALDAMPQSDAGLRLASMSAVGMPSAVLARVRRARPGISVTVRAMTGPEQLAAVSSGELSAAWIRLAAPPPVDLDAMLVRFEPLVLAWPHCDPSPERQAAVFSSFTVADPGAPPWTSYLADLAAALGVDHKVVALPHPSPPIATLIAAAPPGHPVIGLESIAGELAAGGAGVFAIEPIQPYYPWSLVWRRERRGAAVDALLAAARALARSEGWLEADPHLAGVPWLPDRDPYAGLLGSLRDAWSTARSVPHEARRPAATPIEPVAAS